MIAALWLAFGLTHMGLSSQGLRPRLVAKLGDQGFQGMYSLVALAIFVPLCWIYFANRHAGDLLWYGGSSAVLVWICYVLSAAALTLLVGGLLRPSPTGMLGGNGEVVGTLRITRHPLFMAFGLLGLAHLIAAPIGPAELAFFGGLPVFAVIGCRHQDARKLATGGDDFRRFYAETSLLPFTRAASLRGLRESPVAVAVGIALAVGLRALHPWLFG